MKHFALILLLPTLLAGCASMDAALSTRGIIDTSISKMDGTRTITMSPVLSKSGMTDIQAEFGLYWDDAKGDDALLIVEIDGAQSFSPEKPLEVKVDGELFELRPSSKRDYGDVETHYGSKYVSAHNKSTKSYVIHKSQILKIANGKQTSYRIWFIKNRFAEGDVSYEYPDLQSFVPFSFKRFYTQVWK